MLLIITFLFQKVFSSVFISGEVKLREARELSDGLGHPNNVVTACAGAILYWIQPYFKEHAQVLKLILEELLCSIYLLHHASSFNPDVLIKSMPFHDRNKILCNEVNVLKARKSYYDQQKLLLKKEIERRKVVFNSTVRHWQNAMLVSLITIIYLLFYLYAYKCI